VVSPFRQEVLETFLPRMCVDPEIQAGVLVEVAVKEIHVERQIRPVQPGRRALSCAGQAFLGVVQG